jgi:hypothetical protein
MNPRGRGEFVVPSVGVKPGLTAKSRVRRVVQNAEYAAMTRRIIRAHAVRVAAGDVEALRDLAGLSIELTAALRAAVDGLRAVYSWDEIASRLGVSKQAAQQRFGRPGVRS